MNFRAFALAALGYLYIGYTTQDGYALWAAKNVAGVYEVFWTVIG